MAWKVTETPEQKTKRKAEAKLLKKERRANRKPAVIEEPTPIAPKASMKSNSHLCASAEVSGAVKRARDEDDGAEDDGGDDETTETLGGENKATMSASRLKNLKKKERKKRQKLEAAEQG